MYRTSRLEGIKNNIINIIIKIIPLLLLFVCIIRMEDSTLKLLFEICFVFLLIHAVYWLLTITEPTTYEISEKGIRWVNRWRKGFASWNRIYVKYKDDKVIICVRFAFLVVKTVIVSRNMLDFRLYNVMNDRSKVS